jgi:flagellin
MSLSILNNVAALYAQNNINSTQSSLQKTLQQLSSGSRINSGADDPSGLAVSDGLNANEAALTQSATNATEGIGMLQTADGALSQVTSLLDQAISIATEIGGGTLTGSTTTGQIGSANQEYSNILSQIADIGSSTNYNSTKVFTDTAVTIGVSDGTSSGTSSYADTVGTLTTSNVGSAQASGTASNVGSTTAGTGATATLALAVGNATNTVGGTLTIDGGSSTYNATVTAGTTMAQLAGQLSNDSAFAAAGLSITSLSSNGITIADAAAAATLTNGSAATFKQTPTGATIGAGTDLATTYSTISTSNSTAAAQQITNAIASVAYQRGTIGADINQLSSAASVASAEQVNLSSAQNSISATDYGQAASNLSKYQILSQTGISALAQANSVQQEVLKLLQ